MNVLFLKLTIMEYLKKKIYNKDDMKNIKNCKISNY